VIVIGIDPSVRATAIVAVPLDWGGDWEKVKTRVVKGAPASVLYDRVMRNRRIIQEVAEFLAGKGQASAFIEDYAYSMTNRAHHLGELGGMLREVVCMSVPEVTEVVVSRARKVLLGKLPKNNQKRAVHEALWEAGARFKTIDEYDAMCIANYGLSTLGGHCFIGAQS
jgi:hypothetical protein